MGFSLSHPFVFLKQVALRCILTLEEESPAESTGLRQLLSCGKCHEGWTHCSAFESGSCGPHQAPTFPGRSPSSLEESEHPRALLPWCAFLVPCRAELERSIATSSKPFSGRASSEPLWDPASLGLEPSWRWFESQSPVSFSSFPSFLIIPVDFLCIPSQKRKEKK